VCLNLVISQQITYFGVVVVLVIDLSGLVNNLSVHSYGLHIPNAGS